MFAGYHSHDLIDREDLWNPTRILACLIADGYHAEGHHHSGRMLQPLNGSNRETKDKKVKIMRFFGSARTRCWEVVRQARQLSIRSEAGGHPSPACGRPRDANRRKKRNAHLMSIKQYLA